MQLKLKTVMGVIMASVFAAGAAQARDFPRPTYTRSTIPPS